MPNGIRIQKTCLYYKVCVSRTVHNLVPKKQTAKERQSLGQPDQSLLYMRFRQSWQSRLKVESETDNFQRLEWSKQVMIFKLRTGHWHLLPHLYKLNLSVWHTIECLCGAGIQTPEQPSGLSSLLRHQTWSEEVDLQKLLGWATAVRRTADFASKTGMMVWTLPGRAEGEFHTDALTYSLEINSLEDSSVQCYKFLQAVWF